MICLLELDMGGSSGYFQSETARGEWRTRSETRGQSSQESVRTGSPPTGSFGGTGPIEARCVWSAWGSEAEHSGVVVFLAERMFSARHSVARIAQVPAEECEKTSAATATGQEGRLDELRTVLC